VNVEELMNALSNYPPDRKVYIGEFSQYAWKMRFNPLDDVQEGRFFEGHIASMEPTEEDIEDGTQDELFAMPFGVFLFP